MTTHQYFRQSEEKLGLPLTDSLDGEIDELVRRIFGIIPSYYDEREADQIKWLVMDYIAKRLSEEKLK